MPAQPDISMPPIAGANDAALRAEIARLTAALADARGEALEEAAKLLRLDATLLSLGEMSGFEMRIAKAILANRAHAIRALSPTIAQET